MWLKCRHYSKVRKGIFSFDRTKYNLSVLVYMPLPVVREIKDRAHFMEIIHNNPGLIVMKFGAKWCGPCQLIEKDISYMFSILPDNVQCMSIDIDLYPDVYAFLKAKRIVNGIPVILCYKKDNHTYVPDDIVIGADNKALQQFFGRVIEMAKE